MRVAEQAERQVIAVMQSSPRRSMTALAEVSGAALAVEDLIEGRDRDAGWAADAGLVQPRATSSASVPTAEIKSPTLPGSHVHNKCAPIAAPT